VVPLDLLAPQDQLVFQDPQDVPEPLEILERVDQLDYWVALGPLYPRV